MVAAGTRGGRTGLTLTTPLRCPPTPALARGQRRTVVDVVGRIARLGLPAGEAFHFHAWDLALDQPFDAGQQFHFLAVDQ
jgi:hypothetical protein